MSTLPKFLYIWSYSKIKRFFFYFFEKRKNGSGKETKSQKTDLSAGANYSQTLILNQAIANI